MAKAKAAPARTERAAKPTSAFFKGADESSYRGQAARWQHDEAEEGETLCGKLVAVRDIKFKDGKEGKALVFSPAMIDRPGEDPEAFRVIETIYSTVLAQRITAETDLGVTFAIAFTGREKSEHKGRADFKTFTVAAVSPDVLRKALHDAGEAELVAMVASVTE